MSDADPGKPAPGLPRLPGDVVAYDRTREFDQDTIPAGLRRRHATKAGVWARIVVVEGALRYRVLEPEAAEWVLTPEIHGVAAPAMPHEVEPLGGVRFYVEFLRGA